MIRAFATGILATAVVLPCSAQVSVDSRRSDVVVLTAAGANDTTERAAGMYVGHDASNAFFITAAHALTHAQAGNVQITPYGSAVPIGAGIVEQKDDVLDLAVVYIPVGSLPGGISRAGSREPVNGSRIRIIGNPAQGDWQTWTGVVQNEVSAENHTEWFSGNSDASMAEGFSGGPVFDDAANFVGMHLAATASYTVQIRSSAILTPLNAWHVPTDNIAFEDTDTRRFRFAREMVQALRDDNIDLARTNFSTAAKDSTSNQQLRTVWSTDVGVLGSFQAVASQSKRVITGSTLYVTRMTFTGGALELRLLFDNDDHIINLWLATLGSSTSTQLEEAAKAFIQQMADQKFEQIYANVPESLKLYTSAQALQQTWMGWKGQAGEFVQIDAAQKVIDFDMVVVRCKFERAEILIQVQFSPSLQVMSFFAVPAPQGL
jgi:Trypsin-like peptidase domain/Protein of unknown function (DUF3887)